MLGSGLAPVRLAKDSESQTSHLRNWRRWPNRETLLRCILSPRSTRQLKPGVLEAVVWYRCCQPQGCGYLGRYSPRDLMSWLAYSEDLDGIPYRECFGSCFVRDRYQNHYGAALQAPVTLRTCMVVRCPQSCDLSENPPCEIRLQLGSPKLGRVIRRRNRAAVVVSSWKDSVNTLVF